MLFTGPSISCRLTTGRPKRPPRQRAEAGYVLLLTLVVLSVLTVFLNTEGMQVHASVKAGSYQLRQTEALFLARGALRRMAAELAPKETAGKEGDLARIRGDSLGRWEVDPADWSIQKSKADDDTPESAAGVRCDVRAEDAKLPINRLGGPQWRRLPKLDPVVADAIESRRKIIPDKAGFRNVEDLLVVDGVTIEMFLGSAEAPGIRDLVTCFTDGKVYINAVRPEVLAALPGLDPDTAREIARRVEQGQGFERVEDVQHVLGVTPAIFKAIKEWITVVPQYYRLRATATVEGVACSLEAVVTVRDDKVEFLWEQGS